MITRPKEDVVVAPVEIAAQPKAHGKAHTK
jgi:hypothetical protein